MHTGRWVSVKCRVRAVLEVPGQPVASPAPALCGQQGTLEGQATAAGAVTQFHWPLCVPGAACSCSRDAPWHATGGDFGVSKLVLGGAFK